jgi:hypothetical protein
MACKYRAFMRKFAFLLVVLPCGLPGQNLSVGLIGGGSLTDAVRDVTAEQIRTWSPSKDWIAGLTFEYRLRSQLSFELDAMYRELHAAEAFVEPNGTLNSVSPSPVVTWEIPILAKYRFGDGKLRPFLEGGPSFRATGNLNFNPSHHGATAGIGMETHWRKLSIAPSLRYTRWARDEYGGTSQLNQVELLLEVGHAIESHGDSLIRLVSVGGVAGWGLTTDISSATYNFTVVSQGSPPESESLTDTGVKSWLGGPSVEIHLPRHLSVEIDALSKRFSERSIAHLGNGTTLTSAVEEVISTWQFPMLAKYRFRLGRVNPFFEAGPSFRLHEDYLATHGVATGAGVEMHWHALHLAPQFRYSYWGTKTVNMYGPYAPSEAVVLVGISFGGPPGASR